MIVSPEVISYVRQHASTTTHHQLIRNVQERFLTFRTGKPLTLRTAQKYVKAALEHCNLKPMTLVHVDHVDPKEVTAPIGVLDFLDHKIRVVSFHPTLVILADVAKAVGMTVGHAQEVIDASYLKGVVPADTPGGIQPHRLVDVKGVYELCVKSNRPELREFKLWLFEQIENLEMGRPALPFRGASLVPASATSPVLGGLNAVWTELSRTFQNLFEVSSRLAEVLEDLVGRHQSLAARVEALENVPAATPVHPGTSVSPDQRCQDILRRAVESYVDSITPRDADGRRDSDAFGTRMQTTWRDLWVAVGNYRHDRRKDGKRTSNLKEATTDHCVRAVAYMATTTKSPIFRDAWTQMTGYPMEEVPVSEASEVSA